jgi:hypothetical protein
MIFLDGKLSLTIELKTSIPSIKSLYFYVNTFGIRPIVAEIGESRYLFIRVSYSSISS